MANYNINLKKNKAFCGFLKSLKPGWAEEGGRVVMVDGRFHARTKWLPHEEWWAAYVQADRNHLKEWEIAEFAAVIAAGEDCQLTAPALRFLEFIAGYYCEMNGKQPLKISPAAEQADDEPRSALLSLAEYCVEQGISTRKMRVVSASDAVVVAIISGAYLQFDRTGLVETISRAPRQIVAKAETAAAYDCPF